MARGDIILFEEFALEIAAGGHDLDAHTLKLGIIDDYVTPAASDATPTWSDYSANEVSTAGGYTSGGETLTNVTYTEAGGVATLDADPVTLDKNVGGFTDGYWGILYNSSNSNKAILIVDLGGPLSEAAGDIAINWNSSGIFAVTINNS